MATKVCRIAGDRDGHDANEGWLCRSCYQPRGETDEISWREMYGVPPRPDTVCEVCSRCPSPDAIAQAGWKALLESLALGKQDGEPTGSAVMTAAKGLFTVDEAAALLGTTRKGIYALRARGRLPRSVGPGRRLLFKREELEQATRRAPSSARSGR